MTRPSAKTLKKAEMKAIQQDAKKSVEETQFSQAIVMSLLRVPGIYKLLPKLSEAPQVHIHLVDSQDGRIIVLPDGLLYHVPVAKNNLFYRAIRTIRKWTAKKES